MELTLEQYTLSGYAQEGTTTITFPSGRYKLHAVRTHETCLQLGHTEHQLSEATVSNFSLLLLTYAQKSHIQEAVWLTVL